jgi:hypothetical protein
MFDVSAGGFYIIAFNDMNGRYTTRFRVVPALLKAFATAGLRWGSSIAMTADGSQVFLGAGATVGATTPPVLVYQYSVSDAGVGRWDKLSQILPSSASDGRLFGTTLSASADGFTLIVRAFGGLNDFHCQCSQLLHSHAAQPLMSRCGYRRARCVAFLRFVRLQAHGHNSLESDRL